MKPKLLLALFFLFSVLLACRNAEIQKFKEVNGFAALPVTKNGERVATFAGGCFWAMQECMIQLKGVKTVISGYAGGDVVRPTYEEVLQGNTGHAEAVQVYYDPNVISFERLAEAFFHAHDPTQLNRQGPDIGTDYRSIAFYRNKEEYQTLVGMRKLLDSTTYKHGIVTAFQQLTQFYPAEMEHQDYYKRNNWDPYIRHVSKPKVLKLQKAMPAMIKSAYLE